MFTCVIYIYERTWKKKPHKINFRKHNDLIIFQLQEWCLSTMSTDVEYLQVLTVKLHLIR